MVAGDLFCLKTNKGYGLFQYFGMERFSNPFYVIYKTQARELSDIEISNALCGDHYFERINFGEDFYNFDMDKVINNKKVEFKNSDFGIEENDNYFGKFSLTYLGKYNLPANIKAPKFSRSLEFSYFTGKYKWYITDESSGDLVRKENGKPLTYNKLTPEIAKYPRELCIWPRNLSEHFNTGYTTESYNDAWVENMFEEYYRKNPNMRPTDIKYEDVRMPLPTDGLRQSVDKQDKEYFAFCDRVEEALLEFVKSIDENRKAVQKPLVKLISCLNKIENETNSIGSIEAEAIYEYTVKILRSLKKTRLIETLEALREW